MEKTLGVVFLVQHTRTNVYELHKKEGQFLSLFTIFRVVFLRKHKILFVDKKIMDGIMGYKFKRRKAMKRRVHSERSYRESPVAAKEKMRKEWKIVLEPRTERRIL